MASHKDDDAALRKGPLDEFLEQARTEAATQALKNRLSTLTVGKPSETPEWHQQIDDFSVMRLPNDPLEILRISIGRPEEKPEGAYLSFRGDPVVIEELLVNALNALRKATRSGDDGA